MWQKFAFALDKSTPHWDTNHEVLLIITEERIRVAIPIDAPIVYIVGEFDKMFGGSGTDLAKQILSVMKDRLRFECDNLTYLQGVL